MQKEIIKIIEKYLETFPEDKKNLEILLSQTQEKKDIFNRKNFVGHIVANALIINDKKEVLTIFHNKLKMYIQPGGHVDNTDHSVLDATLREVREETGLDSLVLDPWHIENEIPIFIESHLIPENLKKDEKEHYHHDFMYVFRTENDDIKLQLEEVSDFKWIKISEVLGKSPNSFISKSLTRLFDLIR